MHPQVAELPDEQLHVIEQCAPVLDPESTRTLERTDCVLASLLEFGDRVEAH